MTNKPTNEMDNAYKLSAMMLVLHSDWEDLNRDERMTRIGRAKTAAAKLHTELHDVYRELFNEGNSNN